MNPTEKKPSRTPNDPTLRLAVAVAALGMTVGVQPSQSLAAVPATTPADRAAKNDSQHVRLAGLVVKTSKDGRSRSSQARQQQPVPQPGGSQMKIPDSEGEAKGPTVNNQKIERPYVCCAKEERQ